MTDASPKPSMLTIGDAMRDTRCRASSSAQPIYSAMPPSMAGRKTRRGRRLQPEGQSFPSLSAGPRLHPGLAVASPWKRAAPDRYISAADPPFPLAAKAHMINISRQHHSAARRLRRLFWSR